MHRVFTFWLNIDVWILCTPNRVLAKSYVVCIYWPLRFLWKLTLERVSFAHFQFNSWLKSIRFIVRKANRAKKFNIEFAEHLFIDFVQLTYDTTTKDQFILWLWELCSDSKCPSGLVTIGGFVWSSTSGLNGWAACLFWLIPSFRGSFPSWWLPFWCLHTGFLRLVALLWCWICIRAKKRAKWLKFWFKLHQITLNVCLYQTFSDAKQYRTDEMNVCVARTSTHVKYVCRLSPVQD